jgi:3-deoxy-D-manno-octulosonic-acid transferase
MGLMFRLADVVVMGGSFVERVGGHNPLEPARLGRPIVTGPGDYNFRDVYDQMLDGETAAMRAATEDDLAAQIKLLLTDEARARALGEGAHAFAAKQAQGADQAMATLEALLPAR